MKYKNEAGELFVDPIVENHSDLILLTDEEFEAELAILNMPIPLTKSELKDLIDVTAGNARSRFIAEGSQVVEEYKLASAQTKEWRDAGSPADAVPVSITSWAVAEGINNEQSAAAIEAASDNLNGLLLTIRSIRLAGKAATDLVTNDEAPAVAQGYIDQLDAITP